MLRKLAANSRPCRNVTTQELQGYYHPLPRQHLPQGYRALGNHWLLSSRLFSTDHVCRSRRRQSYAVFIRIFTGSRDSSETNHSRPRYALAACVTGSRRHDFRRNRIRRIHCQFQRQTTIEHNQQRDRRRTRRWVRDIRRI